MVGIKKYKLINKKNKKKHHKIILLAKSKLNSIKFLISKALIDSNIGHDEICFNKYCTERILWYEKKSKILINKSLNYI